MKFELLDFQAEAVQRLKAKRSVLIGDEPGLGKTYEGIALDLLRRDGDGHPKVVVPKVVKTLVIAPKGVLSVWDEHLMELTDEDVYVYDDTGKQPARARAEFEKFVGDPKRGGYFVVHWEGVRLMPSLRKVWWFHIIADECHRAKGRKSQQTVALKKIKTEYKTGMSGTPADNSPPDLWSILNWLWPNFYTSYWAFVKAYTIQETSEQGYMKMVGLRNMDKLHAEMERWFVRRRKQDVLKDLPDKYYTRLYVQLGPKQRRAYDQMKKVMIAWVDEHSDDIEQGNPLIAKAVVSQLVRLQQFAAGYVVPVLDENGKQVVKFVHKGHRAPRGAWWTDECTDKCGEKPQWKVTDPSAKLDALIEWMEDRPDEQVIIFSQYRGVIELLGQRLEAKNIAHGLFTGNTSQADRATLVQDFQAGRVRVFAGTISAGGVGLTLTAASTVVFLDRAWSPAINIQAEDRAHRIGQKNAVEIIDIVARNTVDLGKHQQLKLKWKWLQQLLGDELDIQNITKEYEHGEAGIEEIVRELIEDDVDGDDH